MASVCVIFWVFLFLLWSSFLYFGGVFNKTIIPLALVGYEMIIANSALRASLAILTCDQASLIFFVAVGRYA